MSSSCFSFVPAAMQRHPVVRFGSVEVAAVADDRRFLSATWDALQSLPGGARTMLSRSPSEASLLSRKSGDSDLTTTVEEIPIWDLVLPPNAVPPEAASAETITAVAGASLGELVKPRPQRDTNPEEPAVAAYAPVLKSAVLNDRPDVGNIGCFFGNWGLRASDVKVQRNIDLQIKHGPAQIIGLSECMRETEEVLLSPSVAGLQEEPAVAAKLETREGFEYFTVRGNEPSSVLIAARTNTASGLHLLFWDRTNEGEYRTGPGSRSVAYTRTLIARVDLKNNVGFMGTKQTIMCMHLHYHVANNVKGFRRQLVATWPRMASLINKYGVDVLMGDFNMSLFKVAPELRSCGVQVDLMAWYPWRSTEGMMMSDSAGIFLINKKATVELHVGLECLHAGNPEGIGWDTGGMSWETQYDVWPPNSGPGQKLGCYLPKTANYVDKIGLSISPTYRKEALMAAVAASADSKGDKDHAQVRPFLKIREKRLNPEHWIFEGKHRKGAHFPLCAYTNNVGRRSDEAFNARRERRNWKKRGWKTQYPAEDVKSEADQTWPPWPSSSSSTGWWRY